ncbi:MAG TPA: tetratricopeptide repeat protein [Gemmataceae bacterium]|jgi:tetratricopeptide (TPR) repeat protein|nr:tetratricopeptide repeat protein [Gemmataceae bacterium]
MRADNARTQAGQSVLSHNAARRAGRATLYLAAALIALTSGAAVFWWRCGNHAPSGLDPFPNGTIVDTEDASTIVRNPGYLGPQACAPCHSGRVAEFRSTRHFRACCVPQTATMPAGFAPGRGRYATHNQGLRFEMGERRGEYYETAVRSTPGGEERTSGHIDLVYGSGGGADEIYFTWHGDRLNELPMAWLHPLKRWGAQPFNPYMRGDASRTTTPRCLECHNTWIEHVPGTENRYRRDDGILGVSCERCHGPAAEHVSFHTTHADAETGAHIVKPALLSRDRQMDLCGQCHSNAAKRRGPAFGYRPGESLEDYFRINVNQRQEEDHVANQVHYLRSSKCFQKSATLTCTTCHNPHKASPPSAHVSATGAIEPGAVQRACLKCHQPDHCKDQGRLPAAVRNDCIGCHMPRFTRIQVFFHTEDDQYVPAIRPHNHRIAVYPTARQEVLLGWQRTQPGAQNRQEAARMQKALVTHWLDEAASFHRAYRFMAEIGALREALRFDPTPALREKLRKVTDLQAGLDRDMFTAQQQMDDKQFAAAIQTLTNILAVKPDWAKAHGKLGTCLAVQGQYPEATTHLQAVAKYDPDDAYGYAMLGWLAYLEKIPGEAVTHFRQADEVEPYDAKTNFHLGLALMKLNAVPEAIASFHRVLVIDPGHVEACRSLSQALSRQGKTAEAARFAERAARLTRTQEPK